MGKCVDVSVKMYVCVCMYVCMHAFMCMLLGVSDMFGLLYYT